MRFRPWLLAVTVLYLLFVAWMTLRPSVYGSQTAELLWRALGFFGRHSSTSWLTFDVVESIANALMFVPLGFFLALFFPKRLFLAAVALCVLLSLGIETYQGTFLSSTRVEDFGDVIHNGMGGAIGVLIALFLRLLFLPFASVGRKPARSTRSERSRAASMGRLPSNGRG
jgi:glycopeptide antibiotics resistance protein